MSYFASIIFVIIIQISTALALHNTITSEFLLLDNEKIWNQKNSRRYLYNEK